MGSRASTAATSSRPTPGSAAGTPASGQPLSDCSLCPRLAEFRASNRATFSRWHNAPVPRFGDPAARLLIIGLAPGLRGANRTGRPFTGDGAGWPLYAALQEFGFAEGNYLGESHDGLRLRNCLITNAVRCVPPKNRPTGPEIRTCRQFLSSDINSLPNLRILLALGRIAHESAVRALGGRPLHARFIHGGRHQFDGLVLHASYHCSRYNMNTGRLTKEDLFRVFARIRMELDDET